MKNKIRLIDATALKSLFDERYDDAFMQFHTRENKDHWNSYSIGINWGRNTITDAPTVDAVEVVRCKNCTYQREVVPKQPRCYCLRHDRYTLYEDFCSDAERRNNE